MSSADKSLVEALAETAPMPDLALAPPVPQVERLRLPWTSRVIDTVSTYLPVLLMAVLALGTWWLVKNTPVLDNERQVAPPRHEPDYTMRQFTVQRFAAAGALRVQIEGDELRHYPDNDTLEIDNPRIRATGPDGHITLASAQHALSNGDGSEVQLSGGARVVREASGDDEALEFRGEFLHAFLTTERVRSHLPVTVTQGATEIRADGMSYDNLTRLVEFKGRVRAVLSPAENRKGP
jgi:lipopolysaccharide export system protein LptC